MERLLGTPRAGFRQYSVDETIEAGAIGRDRLDGLRLLVHQRARNLGETPLDPLIHDPAV